MSVRRIGEDDRVRRLSELMEFDHVVTVHADGTVTDGPAGVWAPSLHDGEIDSPEWELITHGYSGQFSYNGPIMHNSESIGGRLAADILSEPGVYVALVSNYSCDDDCDDDCDRDHAEGWAIARRDAGN